MAFKKDFVWGVATSAYQIEGATREDGRGLSVWDTYCLRENAIKYAHHGDVACDHYHRYKEDVALMKALGVKAYRFSVSWSRILPNGVGEVNLRGIAFYNELIDELLANGMTPYLTLFHWDYPDELIKKGGWLNPESPQWFEGYAKIIGEAFGDRVKHFFTINEPQCFVGMGYKTGQHAPGAQVSDRDFLLMGHHVLLGHGRAVKALRYTVPDCKVGYAPTGNTYYPVDDTAEAIEAAKLATFDITRENMHFNIAWWSDPIFFGKYPEKGYEVFGDAMPKTTPEEMALIAQPLDFYGQNIYHSECVAPDKEKGYTVVPFEQGFAKTASNWPVTPQSTYWAPKFLYERYKLPLMITENGLSCHDWVAVDGCIHDPNRIDFITRYLHALKQAIDEGVCVEGYFYWSLLDNFEWAEGYNERFGIVYVDYKTQQRLAKDSFYAYQKIIATQGELI